MEMLFLSGSTFRKSGGRYILLILLLSPFPPTRANNANKQDNPEKEIRAFEILADKGEIRIEFYPDDISTIKKLNSIISVDRQTRHGYEAYANREGFKSFLSFGLPYRIIEVESGKKSAPVANEFPGDWDVYPTHEQYQNFMEKIAQDYPGITRLDTIGESVDGRKILTMKITDNPDKREPEPGFVYSSTMHGDETCGYIMMLRLIDYICSAYASDARITRLVDSLEIWINPLANPDGTYWLGDDTVSLSKKRFNSNNVDLNRNFPGIKGNEHPDGQDYQPENLAQMDFLKSIYMVLGANIHDGEEVINYPFDTWKSLHADDQWYKGISREYADEAQIQSAPVLYMRGFDNGITNGYEWYKVEGGRQDWINYFNHAREVTIEISLDKDPPPEELPFYWHYNYPSLIRLMEQSLYGIHGMIRDAKNGQALKAGLRVVEHDSLHSEIFSDSLTGFFARPLEEGIFDLEISKPGYETQLVKGLKIIKDQSLTIQINLLPLNTALKKIQVKEQLPRAYISGDELYFNVQSAGLHRIIIYDLRGILMMEDQKFFEVEGIQRISLDRRTFRTGIYLLKIVSNSGIRAQKIFLSE